MSKFIPPTLESEIYDGLEALLRRGERSDEHYTWDFIRNIDKNQIDVIKSTIENLDNQILGQISKKWLQYCVDDYEKHELNPSPEED